MRDMSKRGGNNYDKQFDKDAAESVQRELQEPSGKRFIEDGRGGTKAVDDPLKLVPAEEFNSDAAPPEVPNPRASFARRKAREAEGARLQAMRDTEEPCPGEASGSMKEDCARCDEPMMLHDRKVPGAQKFDDLKLPVELVPSELVYAIALVLHYGRVKYGAEHGWKALENGDERYLAAMERHLLAIKAGEGVDPESGLPHDFHLACNSAFRCWSLWNELGRLEMPFDKTFTEVLMQQATERAEAAKK